MIATNKAFSCHQEANQVITKSSYSVVILDIIREMFLKEHSDIKGQTGNVY